MDHTTLWIVVTGSVLFFGTLIVKAIWFVRKVTEDPEDISAESDSEAPPDDSQL